MTTKLTPSELIKNAREINRLHGLLVEASVEASKSYFQHAAEAGKALKVCKANVGHGNWEDWLVKNCPDVSPRTASDYMRLADKGAEIEAAAEANQQRAADLSIRNALGLLKKPGEKKPKERKPRSVEKQLKDLPVDEVFTILTTAFDADQLAVLAELIDKHLAVDEGTTEVDETGGDETGVDEAEVIVTPTPQPEKSRRTVAG